MGFKKITRLTVMVTIVITMLCSTGAITSGAYTGMNTQADAGKGTEVFTINGERQNGIHTSSYFEAKTGQYLTLEIKSSITGGSVDFFLFSPDRQMQHYALGGKDTQSPITIPLSDGRWAYNCNGLFEQGEITIVGRISEKEETNQDPNSQAAISDVTISAKNCNVIILPSDDTSFQYDFDEELFQVSEQVENHTISITADSLTGTLEPFDFSKDTRIRIYIPEQAVNEIRIIGDGAGISVLPFNIDIDFTNKNGASRVYLDKNFTRELRFVSTNGSGAINMQDGFMDYNLAASVISSAFSPAEGMPGFDHASHLYTFTSGKGTAFIKLDVQDGAFAINPYSGEAADLLKTQFDIVFQNK